MCRYGFYTYKSHYACFRCRKTFKQAHDADLLHKTDREFKCPECGGYMANLGFDFKSPRKTAVKEWKIIEGLYTIGKSFYSCGCIGPGYIPQNPIEYKLYLNNVLTEYENTILQLQNQSLEACADKLERITYWSEKVVLVKGELSRL
jgi:DNA-directed RNA polymerase subunit RPC12/RpoP